MPQGTLIWLHGRSDTPERYIELFTSPHSPVYSGFRVRILAAPEKAITIQKGRVVRAWYNIKTLNRYAGNERDAFDFEDIEDSAKRIQKEI